MRRTRNVTESNPSEQDISAQAAEWLLRLEDIDIDPQEPYPDPMERRQHFLAWLGQSPAHVRAFMEITHTYRKLEHADPNRLIDLDAMLAEAQILSGPPQPIPMLPALRRTPQPVLRPRLRHFALAASIAAIAYFIGGQWPFPEVSAAPTYYSTQKGERQLISLNDGSTIYLNSASRISVELDRHLRSVQLLAGEALFNVRHTAVPFHVTVDDALIEDLGTQFDIYRSDTSTQVAVLDGLIQLYCDCAELSADANPSRTKSSARRQAPVTLQAGEQALLQRGGISTQIQRSTIAAPELERRSSWKDGRLTFQGQPLGEAIKDFNRYNTAQLIIDDPTIAKLKIGGTFPTNGVDQFIAALHATFGIDAEPDANSNDIKLVRNPRDPN